MKTFFRIIFIHLFSLTLGIIFSAKNYPLVRYKVGAATKQPNFLRRSKFQLGLFLILLGVFILPDLYNLVSGETLRDTATIMNTSMYNPWKRVNRIMELKLSDNTIYRCHVWEKGFSEGASVCIEILPFTMWASVSSDAPDIPDGRMFMMIILLSLICINIYVKSKQKRKKKKMIITKGGREYIVLTCLLIVCLSLLEAFYAVKHFCNAVCAFIICIDLVIISIQFKILHAMFHGARGAKEETGYRL